MNRIVISVISCLAALSVLASAFAAAQPNYRVDYNTTLMSYQGFVTAAQFHNMYVKKHKGHCGQERAQSWVSSTKSSVASMKTVVNKLAAVWKANYKKQKFKDSIKAAHDVYGYGYGKVQIRFNTCVIVPEKDATVATDLDNLASDLGLPPPVYNG